MLRAAALALLLALPARAAELYPSNWVPVPVNTWGGLNLLQDSTAIGNDAQKAQNVLTDNGYLEKRPGNVILGTILSGSPVKFVTDWVSPNGTRFLIAHASDTIYQTDFSGSPVALSTAQPLFNISFTPAFGRAIFADGYRAPWYWNGTSTGTVADTISLAAAPICTYLAFKDSRIFCANIPVEGTSRVRISSTGGMGYWSVPADVASVDNAPNVFDFTPDDGDSIKCMATTPWGVFVGKQYSSSMIKGTGNLSYELRILDPKVGCKDNRSVQMVYGVLHWLSNDGVYAYDGSGPPRLISRELDPLVANLPYTSYGTKAWLNDIQADWTSGNLTASGPGAPISATISLGSITPSSFTAVDTSTTDFRQGTTAQIFISTASGDVYGGLIFKNTGFEDGTTNYWTYDNMGLSNHLETFGYGLGISCRDVGGAGARMGSYGLVMRSSLAEVAQFRIIKASDGTILYQNTLSTLDAAACAEFQFDVSTQTVPINIVFRSSVTGAYIKSPELSTGAFRNGIVKYAALFSNGFTSSDIVFDMDDHYYSATSTFTSRCFDTGFSTPTWSAISFSSTSVASSSVTYLTTTSSSCSGTFDAPVVAGNGSPIPSSGKQAIKYMASFRSDCSSCSSYISDASFAAATTGYYNSAVHLIGSQISAYGIFTVSQDVPSGATVTFSVRATTYSFTDISGAGIPWTAQTANQNPTISVSTPAYFQFRSLLDFNRPENAPTISRIQTNWNEGTGLPVSSGVWDRRYHLCLTISATATAPDTCLIKQKNGKWVTWTGPSVGAMGLYNYTLIAADGLSTSKVWTIMSHGVYDDDGDAIDSQWVSADYTNGLIFNDKILHEFWVDALPVVTSSVTLSYSVNKSSAYTDYEFYLDNGQPTDSTLLPAGFAQYGSLNQWVPLFTGYDVGKYVKVKFSDDAPGTYFRINAYLLYLENKSRQTPN